METTNSNPQHRIRRGSSLQLIHLDVPLISTRRPSNHTFNTCSPELYSGDTSRRVPFLWERVPGVPKDGSSRLDEEADFFFFPPKPPPGRSHSPTPCANYYHSSEDDGNDGDVDSCSDGDSEEDRWVCDAVEKVSLPYSSAMDCRDCRGVHRSPSFIMNRFLPAANAIAARSTPTIPKHPTRRTVRSTLSHRLQRELIKSQQQKQSITAINSSSSNAIAIQQSHHPHLPSKACGLRVFFPWTFKQTPCGHKSPVLCQTPRTATEISGKKNKRFSFDAFRANERVEDDLSSKAFKSPGWGLPFLDTSRLRLRRRDDERARGREFMEGMRGGGKPSWSLPRLQKPTEPWLSHALNNSDRRY
ncbi:uncharacterized protein LOC110112922 [Dendrobium catenatum]|uniref:Uncharacterized protein n=1 Tax=Dendrobium catenatum TaxID=906689 RepID=A0A2I0VFH8_9ASPA|nr:uncharacterized protein LOC110112922 [Dendrobium catenatum]PKU62188.1 hypothetical protein MA16_Dca011481 [Dendrobium catenatum]